MSLNQGVLHVLNKTKYFEMYVNINRKFEQNSFNIYLINNHDMHTHQTELKRKETYILNIIV